MLDKYIVPAIKPALRKIAERLHERGWSADSMTVVGFVLGLFTVPFIAFELTGVALLLLVLNRLADGLDGELARLKAPTDAGGFLDITLDFFFYALFPIGFALADPATNALPAAVLILSFVGTGASFLAFAAQAQKQSIVSPNFAYKSLYYLNGLAEGTETILCFVLMCLFPDSFAVIAYCFAIVCLITAANRTVFGYRTLKQSNLD